MNSSRRIVPHRELLAKTPIGVAVALWFRKPLIRKLTDQEGYADVRELTPGELRDRTFWNGEGAPVILIMDSYFVENQLGGYKTIAGETGKALDLAFPDHEDSWPWCLIVGETESPTLLVRDSRGALRAVQSRYMAGIDLDEIAHFVGQRAVQQTQLVTLLDELMATQGEMVLRLARAIEARDATTGSHVRRLQDYVQLLAEKSGLVPQKELNLLAQAAALHDIGKLAIPDDILLKPGKLDDDERVTMDGHAEAGAEILAYREGEHLVDGERLPLLERSCTVACSHHEKWNGTGYPLGLRGSQIPLWGRIVAIVDVFDAMVSDRPYKNGMDFDKVMNLIQAWGSEGKDGGHFDPDLTKIFVAAREEVREIYNRFKAENLSPEASRCRKQERG
ncbi:MAG: HD-GYP domain-containing protein [Magnetococcales bacterium]|nr:HD-GYP domain-containing protein [Magnetococcales bacterium]MBF0322812.1 HD-GYP domain-containing protein [Magnetococcales bacterium]